MAGQWLEAGRTIRVPFRVQEGMVDVAAWQFALRFDAAQVAFGQVLPRTAVPLTREEFGVSRALDGELRSVFAVAEGVAMKAGEVAFELELHVRRGGVRLSEVLRLDDAALEGRVYDTALKAGSVALAFRPMANTPYVLGIQPTADVMFELYQNEPNPTPMDAATAIRFHLPEAGSAVLTVRDALGRLVHQQKGEYAEGQNMLLLDMSRLSAQAGGVFTYTLRFEGESGATHTASRRMVVVR